jgi:uncharacterized protein involved in exopolysaccharide biosynthesis
MSDDWNAYEKRLSDLEELAKVRVPKSDASFEAIKTLHIQVKELSEAMEAFPLQVAAVKENVSRLREELSVTLGQLQISINRNSRERSQDRELLQKNIAALADKIEQVMHALRGGGGS